MEDIMVDKLEELKNDLAELYDYSGTDSADESFTELQRIVHDTAKEKGWWTPGKSFGEQVVMMHSELSEAVEEFRVGNKPKEIYFVDGNEKPEGIPIELADAVIRIMDTCEFYGINLFDAICLKAKYNLTRSHRHGDKKL